MGISLVSLSLLGSLAPSASVWVRENLFQVFLLVFFIFDSYLV